MYLGSVWLYHNFFSTLIEIDAYDTCIFLHINQIFTILLWIYSSIDAKSRKKQENNTYPSIQVCISISYHIFHFLNVLIDLWTFLMYLKMFPKCSHWPQDDSLCMCMSMSIVMRNPDKIKLKNSIHINFFSNSIFVYS